jgi:hypothetical protein
LTAAAQEPVIAIPERSGYPLIFIDNAARTAQMESLVAVVRFFLHALSFLALAAAIIAGTVDSIQSVSASTPVLTSLGNAWLSLDPESLTLAEFNADAYISADIWRPYIAPLLAQPAFVVFLVLALSFWIVGYRRERFAGRFSA